jgi:hypothetical protein
MFFFIKLGYDEGYTAPSAPGGTHPTFDEKFHIPRGGGNGWAATLSLQGKYRSRHCSNTVLTL